MTTRLIIRHNGWDVSEEIRRTDAGDLLGYDSAILWHDGEWIGMVSSRGHVLLTDEGQAAGYTFEEVKEPAAEAEG